MHEMNEFFTRQKANEGVRLPLTLPDGTKTEHFLVIRGIDSDAFREAETEAKRQAMELSMIGDEEEKQQAIKDKKLSLVASLVLDWSFEQACSPENVKAFLLEAPQIADQVDQLAARRALFFDKRLSSFSGSQSANGSSAKSRPDLG
ncbi:hypothetical protein VA7868_03923 [Vibrio aerogenes CECT 7868]|uniref:Tail assembly chaperone n=1 Tax=Vibrio aerogenes CECT 7868 TaxID=1216006 RepID=A0A1M6C1K1_9VIBR|nr:hypothetical protein [Vibrio aerogenes]SHI54915.1 hypothetical protein VA7868_03923 [Vibrio aerogenes CECT 7868]